MITHDAYGCDMNSRDQNLIWNFLRHNGVVKYFVRLLGRLFDEMVGKRATAQPFVFLSEMQKCLFLNSKIIQQQSWKIQFIIEKIAYVLYYF